MKAGKFIKDYLKQSLQKSNVITGVVLVFLLGSALLYAGQLTDNLITFTDGTTASASEVNSNFQLLSNAIDQNQMGFACEMTSEFMMTTTPVDFNCDVMLVDNASYVGAYLFQTSESGVYQIHTQIMVASDTVATPYLANANAQLYIDGTSVSPVREYLFLNSGQYIELKIVDTGSSSYYHRAGSMVFVKRIF